jgi:hypothetical protein
MFRKFVSLSAGVLALLCVTGMPGQLYAQHARGGFHSGMHPMTTRFSPGMGRGFINPRFNGAIPGTGRGFINPRFGGFSPGVNPLFFGPPFGGLNTVPMPVPVPVPAFP